MWPATPAHNTGRSHEPRAAPLPQLHPGEDGEDRPGPKGRYYPAQTTPDPKGPIKRHNGTPSKSRSGRWLETKPGQYQVRGQGLRSPGCPRATEGPAGAQTREESGLVSAHGRGRSWGQAGGGGDAHLLSRGVHEVVEEPHLSWPEPAERAAGRAARRADGHLVSPRPKRGAKALFKHCDLAGGRGPKDAFPVFFCEHAFSAKPAAM